MLEEDTPQEQGPLPRSREAVDWWLQKWGRQAVLDGQEPLNREDLERLIEVNGGTAEGLYLPERHLGAINLYPIRRDSHGHLQPFNLRGAILAGCVFHKAMMFSVDLQDADIAWTNLHGACLYGADLRGANLFSADLCKANLSEAKLQRAKLTHANLRDANLAWVEISQETDLEGVKWDKDYISILERKGDYEAAIALYRRLKEWYRGAGMLKIAGEFHYREEEAITKARGQQFWKEIKQLGSQFKEFKRELKEVWLQLKRKDTDTQLKR